METKLTRQERLILLYVIGNHSNNTIAELMEIQYHTVKVHKYNLYKKLGAVKKTKLEVQYILDKFCDDNPDLFADLFAPTVLTDTTQIEVEDAQVTGETSLG